MSTKVLNPVAPYADESFTGYLHRVVAENGYRSTRPLYRLLDMPKSTIVRVDSFRDDIDSWAESLGVATAALLGVLPDYDAYQAEGIDFNGLRFGKQFVLTEYRRVSPKALEASPHHRVLWDIAPMNFCSETWQLLRVNCAKCQSPLDWVHSASPTHCGYCSADLRLQSAPEIQAEDRSDLTFASDIAGHDPIRQQRALLQLPPNIRTLNRGAIIEIALVLGWADGKGERHCKPLPSNPFQDYPHDLVAGIRILRDFSKALALRVPEPTLLPQYLLRLKYYNRALVTRSTREFIASLLASYSLNGKKTLEQLKLARAERSKLNLTEVAKLLRVEKAVVRSLVDAKLMTGHRIINWQRKTDWFDDVEVARVGDILADKISVNDAVGRTGLPYHAFEQLVGLGVLSLNKSKLVKLAFSGSFFRIWAFDDFERSLRYRCKRTAPDDPGRIPLRTCFDMLGQQYKPWGALIAATLDKSLPGGLGIYDKPGKLTAQNLNVSRDLPSAILAGLWSPEDVPQPSRPYCSWAETEEYLNCLPRDAALLLSTFDLLHQVDHGSAGIDRASVLAVGAEFISSAEIAARLSIARLDVGKWAREQGLKRPAYRFPMWQRAEIEPFLPPVSLLFPHQEEPMVSVDLRKGYTPTSDQGQTAA